MLQIDGGRRRCRGAERYVDDEIQESLIDSGCQGPPVEGWRDIDHESHGEEARDPRNIDVGDEELWFEQEEVRAIGAKVKLVSRAGERLLPAAELYNDDGIEYLGKRPDELLTEIHLPPTNGWRATYWKLRRRGSFDFPVLGVASCLRLAGDGTVEDAKIILGGVGPSPLEALAAQKAIIGRKLTEQSISEAAAAAYPAAKPLDNTDFAMSWRKDMARHYVSGTLRELAGLSPNVSAG